MKYQRILSARELDHLAMDIVYVTNKVIENLKASADIMEERIKKGECCINEIYKPIKTCTEEDYVIRYSKRKKGNVSAMTTSEIKSLIIEEGLGCFSTNLEAVKREICEDLAEEGYLGKGLAYCYKSKLVLFSERVWYFKK